MLLNNPTKDERKEFDNVVGDINHDSVGPFETEQPNFNTFRRAKSDSTIAENLGDPKYAAESKATQLSNFPKDSITRDDIQSVRNKMGYWGNEVGDNTMAEFSNSLGLKEDVMKAADPEHNGYDDYEDDYDWEDTNKYKDVFNVFNGQEGSWLDKANKIRDILKGNGNLADKAKEIKDVAPETDAHKEGDDIKLNNGNTVEDALEQSTSVKDTAKEDKTQAEEKEMAGLLGRARPKGLLGAGLLNSRDGFIPGDMSEHADLRPVRKVKPNSDPDSQRLGLNFTDEDRLNWNKGEDRKVGDYTLDEWNTKDKLQNALEEGNKSEVENIVEENPEEAEKALKDDSPLNEEAEQVNDGDKRTDEVNNEAVEEAVKNPENQLENDYGKGKGDGWNNGYVDDFDPNGPDFVSNDDTIPDPSVSVEPPDENVDVVDNGLEDQNQYQDSVDTSANEESVNEEPQEDDTIVDKKAPDVDASKWEQLPIDQKKVDKLNEALYKKQQEIERQDLIVDQMRSYMEENPNDFEAAEKLEREELKAKQLYDDKEKLEKELETASTPEVRLRQEEAEQAEPETEDEEPANEESAPHEASLNYSGAHRVSNTPFSSEASKVSGGSSGTGVGSKLLGNIGHSSGIHAPSVSGPRPIPQRSKGSTANRALPVGGKIDLNGAANNRTNSIPNRSNSEGAGHTMFGVAAMMKPLYRTNMTIKVGETQLPNMSGGHTAEPEALNPEVPVSGGGHNAYTTHSAIADIKQRILTKYPGGIVTNGLSIEVNENQQVTVNGTPLAKVPQEVLKKVEEIL